MRSSRALCVLVAMIATAPAAEAGSADVNGYFRVSARPDFQGGQASLGYWNLYGRLMNERSYGMLDLRLNVLEPVSGSDAPWTSVHARIEGGSIGSSDPGNGRLDQLRLSQVFVRAGNIGVPGVVWQFGTLDWFMGDLGLYDFRPANIFFESVGVSGRIDTQRLEIVAGVGDAGFFMRPDAYSTIITPGGTARVRLGKLELGGGGQLYIEPEVVGKPSAPHATPGVAYEDFVRGEVAESWVEANPGRESEFPNPESRAARSHKVFGYVGFGGFGPIVWNNLYISHRSVHPGASVTEAFQGNTYDIFITDLTDERTVFEVGNEMQMRIIPGRFDITWAAWYGNYQDGDNDIAPTDDDRTVMSTVVRGQVYMTPTIHWLVEGSAASEFSRNGNAYRNTKDSIFRSQDGVTDARGLEYGDSDTRNTVQAKTGLVLSPLGEGVFTRPSLRLLYGTQWSSQNNAFGNDFVVTPDQNNDFETIERHWHHLVSAETEVWF